MPEVQRWGITGLALSQEPVESLVLLLCSPTCALPELRERRLEGRQALDATPTC